MIPAVEIQHSTQCDWIHMLFKQNVHQTIDYNKIDKYVVFSENKKEINRLNIGRFDNAINENNFSDFVNESLKFCIENGYSFNKYAKEIFFNIAQLKSTMKKFRSNYYISPDKPLYTYFFRDGETAFTYNNGFVAHFRVVKDKGKVICGMIPNNVGLINSLREFKYFIEQRRNIIGEILNKTEDNIDKQELSKKLTNITSDLMNQTLPPKTKSNDNSALKEKICEINEAIQEVKEAEQERIQHNTICR